MYVSFLCIVCLHLLSGLFVDSMCRSGSQPFVSLGNFLSKCMMFRHFKDPSISSFPNLFWLVLVVPHPTVMMEMWPFFLMLDFNMHMTQLTGQVCFSEHSIDCDNFVLHISFKI